MKLLSGMLLGTRQQKASYYQKILSISGLIGYWKLNEAVGSSIVTDYSPNINNGTPSNVTFGIEGMGDGLKAASFNASSSYIDISSISGEFTPTSFTISGWFYGNTWAAVTKYLVFLSVNASNRIIMWTQSTDIFFRYYGEGTQDEISATVPVAQRTLWNHSAITVSSANDAMIAYLNGTQIGVQGTLGVWSGTLASTTTCIGSASTSSSSSLNPATIQIVHANINMIKITITAKPIQIIICVCLPRSSIA